MCVCVFLSMTVFAIIIQIFISLFFSWNVQNMKQQKNPVPFR